MYITTKNICLQVKNCPPPPLDKKAAISGGWRVWFCKNNALIACAPSGWRLNLYTYSRKKHIHNTLNYYKLWSLFPCISVVFCITGYLILCFDCDHFFVKQFIFLSIFLSVWVFDQFILLSWEYYFWYIFSAYVPCYFMLKL